MSIPEQPKVPEGTLPVDVTAVLRVARKYAWLILSATVVVTLLSLFWTIRQPKIYEARATLTYDPTPATPLGSTIEDVAEAPSSNQQSREFYDTQNEILQSRSLAELVVRKLSLYRDKDYVGAGPARGDEDKAVAVAISILQDNLRVRMRRGTRLVDITVTDRSPPRAQLVANTIIESYIEKTIEDRLGTTVSALEWLNSQSEGLRKQLEGSEIALHEFKRDQNVLSVSMEDRQNIVATEISTLSQVLTTTRTKRIELSARLEQLKIADREDPFQVFAPAISASEAVQALREQFRTKSAERDALATRYGPQHPEMSALDAQIAAMRRDMRREIDGAIADAAADLNQAIATERGLVTALAQANEAGLNLNLQEIQYTRLNRERLNSEKLYGVLLQRTAETDLTRMLRITHARRVDAAIAPTIPVSPNVPVNLAVGAVLGLLLGALCTFVLARLDRTIRAADEAEALGLTILGVLPSISAATDSFKNQKRRKPADGDRRDDSSRDIIVHSLPRSPIAECCRTIRTNLNFMSTGEPYRTLMVTSAGPREGKTTVATNLAASLAQNGHRVLLVDTDLRRPRIHKSFHLPGNVGVSSVLVGEHTLETAVRETVVPGLFVLPCGPIPPNPSELLDSEGFRTLIANATAMFDKVIFDSPPLGAVTDAAILAPRVDGAVFVAQSRRTSRDAAAAALKQLRDVRAVIFGGVLNNVAAQDATQGYGGYYYYQSGYYGQDEDAAASLSSSEDHPAN